MSEEELIYNFILENDITTEEALNVGTSVGGYSVDTLNHIIYFKTGMHDIEQLYACARKEYVFSNKVKEFYDL